MVKSPRKMFYILCYVLVGSFCELYDIFYYMLFYCFVIRVNYDSELYLI